MSSPSYGYNVMRINKLWFVAIFAGVMFFSIMKTIHADIEQIALDTAATQAQVDALMSETR